MHRQSQKVININQAATNTKKRKMKEVQVNPTVAPPRNNHFSLKQEHNSPLHNLVSTNVGLVLNNGQTETTSMLPFKSFTSLLTEDIEDIKIREQTDLMEQIVSNHSEHLRLTLTNLWWNHYNGLLSEAEERATKTLREKELELNKAVRRNLELEEMAALLRGESQVLQMKVKTLEYAVGSLRAAAMQKAALGEGSSGTGGRRLGCARCSGGGGGGAQEEDAQSSFVDPDRVEPVMLACKTCGKRVATVMLWPCRHVCVCTRCELITKTCPVCESLRTNSVEVFLC